MTSPNALGDFLRARREQIDPADVGLLVTGIRRTPGLRREEVATLAGVSANYYLRLEQGRDRHPSVQILEALARVFGLDPAATAHLVGLSDDRPRRRTRRKKVQPGILNLIETIGVPAMVENRMFDIIAMNSLARALFPSLEPGHNRMRALFLDPVERAQHPDWDGTVSRVVASFRSSLGTDVGDRRIVQLVGELSLESEEFRRVWARHDVRPVTGAPFLLAHRDLGPIDLRVEKLPIADSDGQILATYHAEKGSESAQKLARLVAPAEGGLHVGAAGAVRRTAAAPREVAG